jgi:hypothetical protein
MCNELESKKEIVAWFQELSHLLSEGTETKALEVPVRMIGFWAKIYTRDVPNTKQERYPLKHSVQYDDVIEIIKSP